MVAAVAVETRPKAKRNKTVADEEETPPTPPPPAAIRRHRQPTPDHPPYCWMIGEAIDALGEDGGSAEDSISSFIRAKHPGVPPVHDRFLRHYLAKHVAEGVFVCTAPGRYARRTELAAGAPLEAGSSEAACVEPPVVQVKRGRGRPRKDGSSSSSPHVKKHGSARSATPGRRGWPRGRPRKDGSSSTSPAAKKHGSARSATPKRRGRPPRAVSLAAGDDSVPASSVAATSAVAEKNGSQQVTASKPRRRRRLRKLTTFTEDESREELVTDKEEDGTDAPSTTGKEHGRSLELALVAVGDGAATTPNMDDHSGDEAPSTMPSHDQPDGLALVTTTDVPAPMLPMDTVPPLEGSSQASELALVTADDGPVPLLVPSAEHRILRLRHRTLSMVITPQSPAPTSAAGKIARRKTLSATPPKANGHRRQRELALVTTGACSTPALVTDKKADNTGSVGTIKIKLSPATGGGIKGAPLVAPKPHEEPHRRYPLTADEIPDDPSWCLLALPAVTQA